MRKFALWIFAVISAVFGLFVLMASISKQDIYWAMAGGLLALCGIYLSPPFRNKFCAIPAGSIFFGRIFGSMLAAAAYIAAFALMGVSISKNSDKLRLNTFTQNPDGFYAKVKENVEKKDFFNAQYDLDFLVKELPKNSELKNLKHWVFLKEVDELARQEKLYLLESKLEEYKTLVDSPDKLSEATKAVSKVLVAWIANKIKEENIADAKSSLSKLESIYPSSPDIARLRTEISGLESLIVERREQIKKAEELELAQKEQAVRDIPIGRFYTDRGQVSRIVYKAACERAFADRDSIVTELSVMYSATPEGKLVSNIGSSAISNTKIWWDENDDICRGSYIVSGFLNGSEYNIPISGRVFGFYNLDGKVISGSIGRLN